MKRIGFDKTIKLAWLDEIAFSFLDMGEKEKVYSHLKEFLSGDIKGAESRRKYITVLKRIWIEVPPEHQYFKDTALLFLKKVSASDRLVLHWGMSLLAYPFFRDVTNTAGLLFNLQDELSVSQVKRRITSEWGERKTLNDAIPRVIYSLENWGVLERLGKGIYRQKNKKIIEDKDVMLWLLQCYLVSLDVETIILENFNKTPSLFPFSYHVTPGDLHASNRFEINRQGLDNDVVELKGMYK